MTADLRAELRRAYEERIRWHLDRARAYLAEVPERGALAVVSGQTVNAPPGAEGLRILAGDGNPEDTERERLGMPPRTWVVSSGPRPDPAFLPVGMTYAEALDLVDEAAPELAAALAEELEATAAALLVDEAPEVVAEVVAELPRGVAVSVRRRGRGWFALAVAFWLPDCAADPFARHLATGGTVEPAGSGVLDILPDVGAFADVAHADHDAAAGGEYGAELAAWAAPRMRAAYAAAGADPALVDGFTRRAARGRIMAPLGVPGVPTFAALDVERLFRLVTEARRRWFALDAGREVRAYLGRVAEAPPLGWREVAEALGEALAGAGPLAEVSEETRGGWAGALSTVARGVARGVVELPELDDEAGARGGAVKAAEVLAEALRKVGPEGARKAATVRRRAAERLEAAAGGAPAGELWHPWHRRAWLRLLAAALWADKWRPEALEASRNLTPALPVEVAEAVALGLSVWSAEPGEGGAVALVGRDGRDLGRLLAPSPAAAALLGPSGLPDALTSKQAAQLLRSLDTHRFLLWFLTALREREAAKVPDARVIRVDGGWSALANLAGADRDALRRLVPLLGRLAIPGPSGEVGNLYAFDPGAPAQGQRRGWLALTAGTMLHPGALQSRPRWDRSTMPITGLPPVRGVVSDRGNEHGQLATLRLLVVRRLELAGADLVREGGALLRPGDWLSDLATVGLREPLARWDRVRDAWTAGNDHEPPFLVRVGTDRYHLHPDSHPGARAYLDHGARMSAEGAERHKRRRTPGK